MTSLEKRLMEALRALKHESSDAMYYFSRFNGIEDSKAHQNAIDYAAKRVAQFQPTRKKKR